MLRDLRQAMAIMKLPDPVTLMDLNRIQLHHGSLTKSLFSSFRSLSRVGEKKEKNLPASRHNGCCFCVSAYYRPDTIVLS